MVTIEAGTKILTLINVFTVEPDKQSALVDLLVDATRTTMRHRPGFVSASIHRGMDGTRVVNYAQWSSKEDFEAMTKDPEAAVHMKAAADLASFDPILCEVVESMTA